MSGTKHDQGKTRFELVSPYFVEGVAKILTFGAQKYDPYNWAKGMDYGRVLGALERHIADWKKGIDLDPETGESHLYHAACNLMFLSEFQRLGRTDLDNRYGDEVGFAKAEASPEFQDTVDELIEEHKPALRKLEFFEELDELVKCQEKGIGANIHAQLYHVKRTFQEYEVVINNNVDDREDYSYLGLGGWTKHGPYVWYKPKTQMWAERTASDLREYQEAEEELRQEHDEYSETSEEYDKEQVTDLLEDLEEACRKGLERHKTDVLEDFKLSFPNVDVAVASIVGDTTYLRKQGYKWWGGPVFYRGIDLDDDIPKEYVDPDRDLD